MNILIIDGAERRLHKGEGNFNQSLVNRWLNEFRYNHTVNITTISEGYNIQDERNKFINADLVILQFPVYWFSLPGKTKSYIDDVFDSHQLFIGADQYGRGGMLKGKYILSSTWNALESDFNNKELFFGDNSVDDVFLPIHKAFQYLGLKHLASLHTHDVINNPDLKNAHLQMQAITNLVNDL